MRIIAGEFRGRKLLGPESEVTRPITDRVKQSLFDILIPNIPGARVYDCFAGTGSMGLECLSRGAANATFFEADRSALRLLGENVKSLGLEKRSRIISGDLFHWFATHRSDEADLLFLDPPYRFVVEQKAELRRLMAGITCRTLVIFRHASDNQLAFDNFALEDLREYGGMTVEFLRRTNADAPPTYTQGTP